MVIQDDNLYFDLICQSGSVHIILLSVREPDNTPYLLYVLHIRMLLSNLLFVI